MVEKSVSVLVSGRVQGVGYRWFIATRAEQFGVSGYAKNLNSGDVELHLQGGCDEVDLVIEAAKVGPRWAAVDSVRVSVAPKLPPRPFQIF